MNITQIKDLVTILAAGGALLYFGYKALSGWMLINLDVLIATERLPADVTNDHLAVKVTLAKGKIDSARLVAAEIRVSPIANPDAKQPEPCEFHGIRRLAFDAAGRAEWTKEDFPNRLLTLAAEEKMELGEYFLVSAGVPYRIEVVVRGDRFRGRKLPSLSQWRSSIVVLPAKTTAGAA